jgi:transcriptional regulator with XRE-family HTH domain
MSRKSGRVNLKVLVYEVDKHDLATRYNVSTRTIGRWMKGKTIHTLQDLLNLIAEWDQSN